MALIDHSSHNTVLDHTFSKTIRSKEEEEQQQQWQQQQLEDDDDEKEEW